MAISYKHVFRIIICPPGFPRDNMNYEDKERFINKINAFDSYNYIRTVNPSGQVNFIVKRFVP